MRAAYRDSYPPFFHERGVTLPELIIFIVIVGFAVSGVLLVFNLTVQNSTDPMIRKQALAIAESLLAEVESMPFTFCDPDDANFLTADGELAGPGVTVACAVAANAQNLNPGYSPQPGESRGGTTPFDNVNDYTGFLMTGISDITGAMPVDLSAYNAGIAITASPISAGALTVPASESSLITVTVTGPKSTEVVLSGYRTRYAPNG